MHALNPWHQFRWQLRSPGPYYWTQCAIVNVYLDMVDALKWRWPLFHAPRLRDPN
jgi:hypothetical protein